MSAGRDNGRDAAALDRFLEALETRMHREIDRSRAAWPAHASLAAGGKRLRARLLWWSAMAAGPSTRPSPDASVLVRAAAAIELAHLGSLIHDDIVDGALSRRGIPTLHCAHGVGVATDAGAALAHLASALIAPLGDHARAATRRALLAICRGQARELAGPFVRLPVAARLAIMREKTGAFFELAAGLGARLAGAPLQARAAVLRFARRWAVAFQIADDVLDLTGDPTELGRENGADLRDGVLTLPVLLADDPDGALATGLHQLRDAETPERVAACVVRIVRGGGVARAASIATWWLERATASLASVPATAARQALAALAVDSVQRGLAAGRPRFVAAPAPVTPVAVRSDAAAADAALARLARDPRMARQLAQALEWMLPGWSGTAATRAAELAAPAARVERRLLGGDDWSLGGRTAARALALAHVLGRDRSGSTSPTRALALADCLQCIGIALLCRDADADEHERMAERAYQLRTPTFAPPDTARDRLAAPAPLLALDR